jgi:hypothetical protein
MSKQGTKSFKASQRTARADRFFTKAYADGRQRNGRYRKYYSKKYAKEIKPEQRTVKQAITVFFLRMKANPVNPSPKKVPFGKKKF